MLSVLPDLSRPYALAGQLALHLGREGAPGLPGALRLLIEGTGARSAVLRYATGDRALIAAAGGLLHALPLARPDRSAVELTVADPAGLALATLAVDGVPPHALPALRSACTVLSLVLAPAPLAVAGPAAAGPGAAGLGAARPAGVAEDVTALLADAEHDLAALADSLHDGPVQELVAARYAADAAVLTGDGAAVRQAVQTALVSLRRTMWQLRPRGSSGLVAALEALSGRLVEGGGLPLSLELTADVDVLSPTAAVVAYRLVQAASATPGTGAPEHRPVTVRLAVEGAPDGVEVVVVTLTGGLSLREPGRWRRAATALGGDLLVRRGQVCLTLPVARPPTDHPPEDLPPEDLPPEDQSPEDQPLVDLSPPPCPSTPSSRGPGTCATSGHAPNAKATS